MKNTKFKKIALVHDDLVQEGGAENVFYYISSLFPHADIYTSILNESWKKRLKGRNITTSFLQLFFDTSGLYRSLFFLNPVAFEMFNFNKYDLVISTSSRFAHGIITHPNTMHVAYIHSPSRQIWNSRLYFKSKLKLFFATPFLSFLKIWDFVAGQRPDIVLANSKTPQERIDKYWRRKSKILYPFVEDSFFKTSLKEKKKDYYLIVSRLVYWKKIEIAIKACSNLNLPLKIVGDGPDFERLKSLSNNKNIEFLKRVTESKLITLYKNAKALIITQEEDFGIIALEAQACGTPVLAYKKGGSLETVLKGKTGDFFYPQDETSLMVCLEKFNLKSYNPIDLRNNAQRFSKDKFKENLFEHLDTLLNNE